MCYRGYRQKKNGIMGMDGGEGGMGLKSSGLDGRSTEVWAPLDEFDFFVFHAPNCKLVSKAYARLLWNDFVACPDNALFTPDDIPPTIRELDYEDSLQDKSLEKLFMGLSRERFSQRVQPSLTCPTMCGNMYTASLYSGLVSLLSNVPNEELLGKRIGMFSFGSGMASTLFSLRVVGDVLRLAQKIDLHARLARREKMAPEFYDAVSDFRPKIEDGTNHRNRCAEFARKPINRRVTRLLETSMRLRRGHTTLLMWTRNSDGHIR
jgi:hydroxymethylglutaryl-CoA synthase